MGRQDWRVAVWPYTELLSLIPKVSQHSCLWSECRPEVALSKAVGAKGCPEVGVHKVHLGRAESTNSHDVVFSTCILDILILIVVMCVYYRYIYILHMTHVCILYIYTSYM